MVYDFTSNWCCRFVEARLRSSLNMPALVIYDHLREKDCANQAGNHDHSQQERDAPDKTNSEQMISLDLSHFLLSSLPVSLLAPATTRRLHCEA